MKTGDSRRPKLDKEKMQDFLYVFWGLYHNEGENRCMNCSRPAYRRWDHRYRGYIGFCTTCDITWAES